MILRTPPLGHARACENIHGRVLLNRGNPQGHKRAVRCIPNVAISRAVTQTQPASRHPGVVPYNVMQGLPRDAAQICRLRKRTRNRRSLRSMAEFDWTMAQHRHRWPPPLPKSIKYALPGAPATSRLAREDCKRGGNHPSKNEAAQRCKSRRAQMRA
ncbi:hypothetical protein CPLU01_01889 [Colletotrichum plurivorum]|uniref:Uncharacterized protein n=1 Tax=Colletotrichum plurivorum TaxID=2175906 RepID=A0A8H6KXF4_9PEZI|nr:hypothetical protein CPLU01_01889 [Colletotrichum plurivorum]